METQNIINLLNVSDDENLICNKKMVYYLY